MKNILIILLLALGLKQAGAQTFTLSSKDLGGQFTAQFVAGNFGCNGANESPELHWTNPPAGTKSFAITMYDPDAPTGSGFWHWLVVDIPAGVNSLVRGAGNLPLKLAPAGSRQTPNDIGACGYQGPCPDGDTPHRYVITVYALNTPKLGTPDNATAALTGFMLGKYSIAKAAIIVYCKR